MRSYDDPCGLARALDLVGERWALLVVRELVLGPKRFSDLRRGLPGLSQNVLAQRLRELEEAGVVTRRRLEPPASTWAYELTEHGRELEPALVALAAWGSRTPMSPGAAGAELSADALMLALRTTAQPSGEPVRVELRLDDDRFGVVTAPVARGGAPGGVPGGVPGGAGARGVAAGAVVSVVRGSLARPDAIISGSAAAFRTVVFGGAPLSDLDVVGDRAIAERFVRMFPRPAVSRPGS